MAGRVRRHRGDDGDWHDRDWHRDWDHDPDWDHDRERAAVVAALVVDAALSVGFGYAIC